MRPGDRVTLNPAEQHLAKYLAVARHYACRGAGVLNSRRTPAGDDAADLEGVAAELAFAKLFNLWPDTGIGVRPECDAVLPNGLRVDVKATTYPSGKLLALPGKDAEQSVDLFALVVGTFPGPYVFRGFATRGDLLRPSRVADLGHGPTYAARQDELCGIHELAARGAAPMLWTMQPRQEDTREGKP